ncbi:MAG: hypothetical protein U0165_08630, partial [Polyangiaceae bacterium]
RYVKIAEPCQRTWASLSGDERTRFCEDCATQVTNLSELPEHELSLVLSDVERPRCVRFLSEADGKLITRESLEKRARMLIEQLKARASLQPDPSTPEKSS